MERGQNKGSERETAEGTGTQGKYMQKQEEGHKTKEEDGRRRKGRRSQRGSVRGKSIMCPAHYGSAKKETLTDVTVHFWIKFIIKDEISISLRYPSCHQNKTPQPSN